MVRAMERTSAAVPRALLALGAAGLLGLVPAGCAQLTGGRASEPLRVGKAAGPEGDPYLAHHKSAAPKPEASTTSTAVAEADESPRDGGPGRTIVRSTAHPIASASGGAGSSSAGPKDQVSFDAPIPIRNAERPEGLASGPAQVEAPGRLDEAREVIAKSRARLASLATYQVAMNRQERVGGTLQPAEDVLLSIRREPRAVRLEWPAGPHKGREVLYSTTDPSGMMHVNMADSIIPAKIKLPPGSPMVMRTSRHPITEAGFETILDTLATSFGPSAVATSVDYSGVEDLPAVGRPCHKFTRKSPDGEVWLVFIDAQTMLPAMVQGTSARGELLERYLFRRVNPDVASLASADAFDPDRRWSGSPGLLGRLARNPEGEPESSDASAQR